MSKYKRYVKRTDTNEYQQRVKALLAGAPQWGPRENAFEWTTTRRLAHTLKRFHRAKGIPAIVVLVRPPREGKGS